MRLGITTLLMAGLLAGAMPAQAAGNIQGMRFGDWGGNCEGQACFVQQVLSSNDAPVMVTVIGYAPGKPLPTIIFELPAGSYLKAGVQLQVDKNPPVKFTGSCTKDYCRAGFAMDESMLQQFHQGQKASLTFTSAAKQKPTALPLSLKGAAKALDMLSQ
jgi:invasion protein IalB